MLKVLDRIKIEVIARNIVLSDSEHVVESNKKGLFVTYKGFKLYLKDVKSKITKLN